MDILNVARGQVRLKETQQPIPNVIVELFSKDVFGVFGSSGLPGGSSKPFIRLGSVLTDANGEFTISYEDLEQAEASNNPLTKLKRRVRNLSLEIRAPEEEGRAEADLILYKSDRVREQAGPLELFQVNIPQSKLLKAGIPLPGADDTSDDITTALTKTFNTELDLKNNVKQVLKSRVDALRTHENEKENKFLKPFSNSISRVHDTLRSGKNFIKDGDSVEQVTKENILQKINHINNAGAADNSPESTGIVHLNAAQKSKYFKQQYLNAQGEYELPEDLSHEILTTILKKNADGENDTAQLLFRHPLEKYSRKKNEAENAFLSAIGITPTVANNPNPAENHTVTTDDVTPANAERDVPLYVAKQMQHVVSPEGPVLFGVGSRATLQEIQNNVNTLSLRTGPADNPAYFDFHTAKIAFEHVWQEAIDEGVLNLAKDAYDEIVELGGTPPENPGGKVHVQQLKTESRAVVKVNPGLVRKGPKVVQDEFPQAAQVWSNLNHNQKQQLQKLAENIQLIKRGSAFNANYLIQKNQKEGNSIIQSARATARKPIPSSGDRRGDFVYRDGHWAKNSDNRTVAQNDKDLDNILSELEDRLKKNNYSFVTFAANEKERSVNFGLMLTYRQKWDPTDYQVGELVKTIPLAPRETRKYTKKTVVKKKRSVKEMENSLQILKTDSSQTGRAESEIVDNANAKTDFSRKSGGGADVAVASGSASTNFTAEASRESKDLKKNFRENVFKAAQEYKNERKVEIGTEESYDSEVTESGEISNPNDELAVTYLFYELQRRYKVTERMHRLQPVIFVAQEMPRPNEIDEDFLLTCDWIIRQVLLDDSFLPALNFLTTIASDAFVLEEMEEELERQRKMVDDTRISFEMLRRATESHFRALQKSISQQAGVTADKDPWDAIPLTGDVLDLGESVIKGIGGLFGFGNADDDKEAARIRREAAMEAFERAENQQKETLVQLKGEIDKLHALSEKYNQKMSEKIQKETQIARLRVHIKDNILHYMHAIWSHEHPDQRFFRLFNVKVPSLQGNAKLQIKAAPNTSTLNTHFAPGSTAHEFHIKPNIGNEFTTLEQVAELDNLLGYKGNYMIFPLKKSNALTDFMMAPYLDAELGLKDPDEFGNWTLDEFLQYVAYLKAELPKAEFDALIPQITAHYKKLITDPLRQNEEIIVPTGSLYIEALPGKHPILEDFKLVHRAVDVKKVQAEVRKMEIENIRLAARVLKGELEDPDVEKKVVVENGVANVNVSDG